MEGLPTATDGEGVALGEGFAEGLMVFKVGLAVGTGAADITTAIVTTISTASKLILRCIVV